MHALPYNHKKNIIATFAVKKNKQPSGIIFVYHVRSSDQHYNRRKTSPDATMRTFTLVLLLVGASLACTASKCMDDCTQFKIDVPPKPESGT